MRVLWDSNATSNSSVHGLHLIILKMVFYILLGNWSIPSRGNRTTSVSLSFKTERKIDVYQMMPENIA